MIFRRSRKSDTSFPFPGSEHALDGHAAVYATEAIAGEALVVQASPDLDEITGPLRNLAPGRETTITGRPLIEQTAASGSDLSALVAGYAAAGLRTAAMAGDLHRIREELSAAAGRRLGCVYHITGRAAHRHGSAIAGAHDDYIRASGSGAFLLFAVNAQEAADLALIAHRVAEA